VPPLSLTSLHQHLLRTPGDRMLQLLQLILHLVQPIDQPFKILGHATEQGRHLGVFKVFKFGDDCNSFPCLP